jgi:hypothetical protein
MGKRLVLLASFFTLTPFFIFALVSYQLSLLRGIESRVVLAATTDAIEQKIQIVEPVQTEEIVPIPPEEALLKVTYDAKVAALEKFFVRYDSPLVAYTEELVEAAEKHGLDYRLLPAIAMQESLLCLRAPEDTNNCWGFGIYGKKKTSFASLSRAIEVVSETLAREYHQKGLVEPEEIMTKYSPNNTNDWAGKVSYVMTRIGTAL